MNYFLLEWTVSGINCLVERSERGQGEWDDVGSNIHIAFIYPKPKSSLKSFLASYIIQIKNIESPTIDIEQIQLRW